MHKLTFSPPQPWDAPDEVALQAALVAATLMFVPFDALPFSRPRVHVCPPRHCENLENLFGVKAPKMLEVVVPENA